MIKVRHIRLTLVANAAVAVAVALSHGAVVPAPSAPAVRADGGSHGLTASTPRAAAGPRVVLAGTRCTMAGRC